MWLSPDQPLENRGWWVRKINFLWNAEPLSVLTTSNRFLSSWKTWFQLSYMDRQRDLLLIWMSSTARSVRRSDFHPLRDPMEIRMRTSSWSVPQSRIDLLLNLARSIPRPSADLILNLVEICLTVDLELDNKWNVEIDSIRNNTFDCARWRDLRQPEQGASKTPKTITGIACNRL